MKQARHEIKVVEENCTGCHQCEHICPTGAIVMQGRKPAFAVADNSKCVACFRCVDICERSALLAQEKSVPILFGTDPESVDRAELSALCRKAGLSPDAIVCTCSATTVREIAAAILKGAGTLEEVALATGAQSGCLMYCFAPIHRLLTAHLGPGLKPTRKGRWYPTSQGLFDVSEEVAKKYSKFNILEEQRSYKAIMAGKKM